MWVGGSSSSSSMMWGTVLGAAWRGDGVSGGLMRIGVDGVPT